MNSENGARHGTVQCSSARKATTELGAPLFTSDASSSTEELSSGLEGNFMIDKKPVHMDISPSSDD